MLCIKCGLENLKNEKLCAKCGVELLLDSKSKKIRGILYKSKIFHKKKKYDTGIRFCSFKLSDYPDCALLYNNLAAFYLSKKNIDESRTFCQRALDINPDLGSAKEIYELIKKEEKKNYMFFKDTKSIMRLSLLFLISFAVLIIVGSSPSLLELLLCGIFISCEIILYNAAKHNYIPKNVLKKLKIEDYRNISKIKRALSVNFKEKKLTKI